MKLSMLKIVFIPFSIFMLSAFVLTYPVVTVAQPTDIPAMKLKFATHLPPVGPLSETSKWYCDEITKRTGGKVQFDFFWSQALMKDSDQTVGCGQGIADMVVVGSAQTVERNPCWTTLDMPGNGTDIYSLIWAGYEMMNKDPDIVKELRKMNIRATFGYASGSFFFETKKPIAKMEDLKGLRIRSYGGAFGSYLKHAGMQPVFMSMADIYDGLSKGVIDAASSVMAFTWSMKFYEVAPYITWSNSTGMVTATTMLINLDRWNKFPQSLQSIIDKIALEYNDRLAQILITNEENYLKEMTTKYNVKFHKFSPEEDARLSECAKKAQEEWFANPKHKGVPVRAVWDRFQALVKKYDAEVATKGYPWKRR